MTVVGQVYSWPIHFGPLSYLPSNPAPHAQEAKPSPRVPGLLAGVFQVSDDFDDPLPEDFLITDA
jgi:hypothetical protein